MNFYNPSSGNHQIRGKASASFLRKKASNWIQEAARMKIEMMEAERYCK